MKNFLFLLFFVLSVSIYAQKTEIKLCANNWKVTSLAGSSVPEGLTMIFQFKGSEMTIGSEYDRVTYNFQIDKKNILINNNEKKETWKIIKLNKNEFVFTDEKDALIKLVKTNEDFPVVSMKKGED
jgi:hypothetical protein